MNDKSYRKNVGLIVLESKEPIISLQKKRSKKPGNFLKVELIAANLQELQLIESYMKRLGIKQNQTLKLFKKAKSLVSL